MGTMTPLEIVGIVATLLACMGSFVGLIFYGGKLVGRIELVANKFDTMQARLDAIPVIEQRLEFQEEWLRRLDTKNDSTRAHAIRAEAHSQHDGE